MSAWQWLVILTGLGIPARLCPMRSLTHRGRIPTLTGDIVSNLRFFLYVVEGKNLKKF